MDKKKLLIIDDLMVTREGLVTILNKIPDVEVGKVFDNSADALEEIKHNKYDLAMIDLELGNENGILVGRQLVQIDPELFVIIYTKGASIVIASEIFRNEYATSQTRRLATSSTAHNSVNPAPSFTTSGLHGYLLLKNITPASLKLNLGILYQQGSVVDSEILDLLLERLKQQKLTPREAECSELVSQGKSNKEIAQELGITQQAIENLLNSLYHKLSIAGEPKDPGRRVLLARTMERWRGLSR